MRFNAGAFGTPPVVKNLMIINGLFFLAQNMLPNGLGDVLTMKLALFYWESDYFRVWQYITHMFLHADLSHLFFNMFSLWMFGRTIEYDLGSKRFLTFYLISGIGAALLYSCANWIEISYYRDAIGSSQLLYKMINTPTIGASGAVYAVLLGFGMLHPNSVIMLMLPPIPLKAKYFVIIFMVLELVLGFSYNDNVAHFAHVGGMVWAFLLLRYWKIRGKIYY